MRVAIGLDHQGGGTGGERRRLAGAAAIGEVGRLTAQIGAAGLGVAGHPVEIAGRHQIDGAAGLRVAARAERADVVVQPALGREIAHRALVVLRVEAEGGGRAGADHQRVRRRRADRVGGPRVAAGDGDRDAGRNCRIVEQLVDVERGGVGNAIAAVRLVEDIHVVGVDRVIDRLEEVRGQRVFVVAEHHETQQRGARRHALDADVAGPGQAFDAVILHVVGDEALSGDGVRVEERLAAIGIPPGAVTGKILVVEEHAAAEGTDEVGVLRVDAVGDPGHLDAAAGVAERAGGLGFRVVRVGVGGQQRLRVELNLAARRAGAGEVVRGGRCRAVQRRPVGQCLGPRGTMDHHVVPHRTARRVGPQPGQLVGGGGGGPSVAQAVRVAARAPARGSSASSGAWAASARAPFTRFFITTMTGWAAMRGASPDKAGEASARPTAERPKVAAA